LSLAIDVLGSTCFSAGLDSTIRCWSIPTVDIDQYDTYGNIKICTVASTCDFLCNSFLVWLAKRDRSKL